MNLIDTHSHLYVKEFDNDLEQVIKRAKANNVEKIILPAIDSETHNNLIDLYLTDIDFFVPLMGLHPTSVNKNYKKELDTVEKHLSDYNFFKGIGEIGIDLYWDKTYFKQQQEAFQIQVNWAKQLHLPIVIHTRNSFQETFKLLEPLQDGSLKGIFHCFGGSLQEAEMIINLGFKLGIGGVVTFKNTNLRETLKNVQLEHLVIETDSPYLAPVPYRGKRNESAYVKLIAEQISKIYNTTTDQIASKTTETVKNLFTII